VVLSVLWCGNIKGIGGIEGLKMWIILDHGEVF
jgi:hypothetical protein